MKKTIKKWLPSVFMILGGGGVGFILAYFYMNSNASPSQMISLFLSVPLFYLLHIIIHEAGHGLFGQATGYKMLSYRVLSFLWIWENNRLAFKRQKIAGTLGQCLMRPPAYEKDSYPFKLYLLGGVLANLIVSLLALLLFQFNSYSIIFAFIGLFSTIQNIMPLSFNDGMTLKIASSNERMQYLLFLQLEINYQLSIGKTYQELPVSYFTPLPKEIGTYFATFHELIRCGYQLERLNIQGGRVILEELWQQIDDIIPMYQVEIKKELLFCLALLAPTDERVKTIMTNKQVKASLKLPVMANKRILASYAYFIENDWEAGAKYIQEGVDLRTSAPLLGEAKIELKVIDWLEKRARVEKNRREGHVK